jgi:hypothetical protein
MSALRSTAVVTALLVVGFTGPLALAGEKPVQKPAPHVYADIDGPREQPSMTPPQIAKMSPQEKNGWEDPALSSPVTGCDLRCRTGFFGYR